MSQYLPTGNFNWLDEKEVEKLDLEDITNNSKKRYIYEVNVEYPDIFHDFHDY